MRVSIGEAKNRWDARARHSNSFNGEELYTITPLPYYLKRRNTMLGLARSEVERARTIMDFGCGDGWYLAHFREAVAHPSKKSFSGLDISPNMVERARNANPKLDIYVSSSGIKATKKYDLVYSFATLAHVGDESIRTVLSNIERSLERKGRFMLFEQTAPYRYSGDNFTRRTIKEYSDLAEEAGFRVEKIYLLSFRAHALFERHIAKRYVRWCRGDNEYEKRLHANSHKLYRSLSKFFLLFDRNPVHEDAQSGWGNVLMIFEKVK